MTKARNSIAHSDELKSNIAMNQQSETSATQAVAALNNQISSTHAGSTFILYDPSGLLVFTGLLCLLIWLTKQK
jgi:hypothetical protein